ncbi:phage/plasmid primase, P4 family [Methylorubrum rhodesianum]|uniref:Phage/plasmid primase, P4 family n=1 Tax=Methylorubrum rhodesianum TaxID=29427 RepID=A0ABU9ZCL5_9HYPH
MTSSMDLRQAKARSRAARGEGHVPIDTRKPDPRTGSLGARFVGTNGSARRILDPKNPLACARALVAEEFIHEGHRTLHRYRGLFYRWNGACYEPVDQEAIRAQAWTFLAASFTEPRSDLYLPIRPTRSTVSDLLDALAAVTNLSATLQAPCWLAEADARPAATEFVVVQNGLLHLPTGDLYDPTAAFFGFNATGISFDAEARAPAAWLSFLDTIFTRDEGGIDVEAQEALQDWFGYCLLPDTGQQKILLLVGPPRSGKGTVMSILKEVVGRNNVVAPTLDGLGSPFGLEPLIDKTLAVVGDARLSGRADQAPIVENLLSISGEDIRTINRKYMPSWTGQLPTRFFISTNLVPRLTDESGALAKRFIIVTLDQTFLGREDLDLKSRLLNDLPGILNWARDGYLRLRERRRFVQPSSGAEAIEDLETLSSPITAFLRAKCEVGAGYEVEVDRFFQAWKGWCEAEGRQNAGTKNQLGRDLKSVLPAVKTVQHRSHGSVDRYYAGIRLKYGVE